MTALTLLALLALGTYFYRRSRRNTHEVVSMHYSRVTDLQLPQTSLRLRLARLPAFLLYVTVCCFAVALLNPKIPLPADQMPPEEPIRPTPQDGIAIYLLLDHSGSMNRSIAKGAEPTKLQALKKAAQAFIESRPHDLIGLIAFARTATILSPLTLDKETLYQQLRDLRAITDPTQDGTGIGYAIFKTVNLIAATKHFAEELAAKQKPSYTIKSAAIVLVTDGFQRPNDLDKGKWLRTMGMEEAADFAAVNQVHLYLVNVEPSLASEEFAPHRKLLERVAETTGGRFFLSSSKQSLQEIFQRINELEKSSLPVESLAQVNIGEDKDLHPHLALFPWFIAAGLLALAISLLLDTTVLRRVP